MDSTAIHPSRAGKLLSSRAASRVLEDRICHDRAGIGGRLAVAINLGQEAL